MTILNEGFDYHDLVGQILPEVSIDKYAAKMGSDDEIVTLAFTLKGEQPAKDLVDWLERGYDWILDSQVSEGEITRGRYLVFAEMNRRTTVANRVIELIEDLETLCDMKVDDWKLVINDTQYSAEAQNISTNVILSPHDYREAQKQDEDSELNEMREIAGIQTVNSQPKPDDLLRNFLAKAGL
jgi:hypothetical protein